MKGKLLISTELLFYISSTSEPTAKMDEAKTKDEFVTELKEAKIFATNVNF